MDITWPLLLLTFPTCRASSSAAAPMTKVECRTTALAACATVSMAEAKATHSTTPAEGVASRGTKNRVLGCGNGAVWFAYFCFPEKKTQVVFMQTKPQLKVVCSGHTLMSTLEWKTQARWRYVWQRKLWDESDSPISCTFQMLWVNTYKYGSTPSLSSYIDIHIHMEIYVRYQYMISAACWSSVWKV